MHYFALLFALLLQSTPEAIDWAQLLLTSGVIIAIVGVVGNIVIERVKTANAEHLAKVNEANDAAAVKAKEALASAQAERQQDTDLSAAMLQLTRATGQLSAVSARQADILERLADKQTTQHNEASEERRKIMAGIAVDVQNVETELVQHRREGTEWVASLHVAIEDLKEDLTLQIGTIVSRLNAMPSSEGQKEATQQIVEALTAVKKSIEAMSQRLPEVKPPVIEPTLAADGVIAPTGNTEAKPQ